MIKTLLMTLFMIAACPAKTTFEFELGKFYKLSEEGNLFTGVYIMKASTGWVMCVHSAYGKGLTFIPDPDHSMEKHWKVKE